MNKKIIAIIITAGLIGGFFGSLAASDLARASVLDNIWNFITGSNATSTPLTAPAKAVTPYAPTIDYEQAIISAVEKASPSVVSVVISKDLPVIEQCPYSPWSNLPPEFQQFFGGDNPQFTQPCDTGKTQRQEVGGGSGFIISSDGMILTNKHVVSDTSADYTVLTNDGKKYDAKVLARDPAQDLAVLKIDANDLPVVSLGDSDSIKLGQTAIAIGNALGEFRNTVSVGAISGLYRSITASGGSFGSESLQNLIQTDALNLKGEVVGIDTAVASDAQNIGFAIPINQAKRDIQSVKATGSIKIPYLGVRYIAVTSDVVKSQKLSVDHGALVRGSQDGPAVIKGSPADKAGVQAEDIILEVNGVKVDENNALTNLVQRYNIGDTITLKIQRGDKTLDIPVTLTERPANQ
ncbi:MAG: trypsin-like peptidase domain-containing protein [Minisyncoccia bacterium]